ncbi:indolepyruvate ferredoxin oxidoreductase subunit alpha [Billgrantia sp. Q4P2]|uniref:indolepyruvate ferredoxin oxidoreductase subunit alpha n=1 Tax=Billgrantia sp. Q4P2 TaxID=3463857 RepID=UPI004056746B
MAYVVGRECVNCKHTDCVDVCPVDAFREARELLVICPDTCIDCGVCEPECPEDAIFSACEAGGCQEEYIQLNRLLSEGAPKITKSLSKRSRGVVDVSYVP